MLLSFCTAKKQMFPISGQILDRSPKLLICLSTGNGHTGNISFPHCSHMKQAICCYSHARNVPFPQSFTCMYMPFAVIHIQEGSHSHPWNISERHVQISLPSNIVYYKSLWSPLSSLDIIDITIILHHLSLSHYLILLDSEDSLTSLALEHCGIVLYNYIFI